MATKSDIDESITIDQVIKALRYYDDEIPVAALQSALRFGDAIVPALIAEINSAVMDSQDGEVVTTNSHWISVMLLTLLDAKEALPAILEVFRYDTNENAQLFGDILTEDFKHFVAQLAGSPSQLISDIEDLDNDEFYRGALVHGIFGMVAEGKLSRADAVRFLMDQTSNAIEREDSELVSALVSALTDLADPDSQDLVMRTFDREMVDEFFIDRKFCQDAFAKGEEFFGQQCDSYREKRITDPVQYLNRWRNRIADEESSENVNEAIECLRHEDDDKLVESAVRWLRNHRDEATPGLIQLLRDSATVANDDESETNSETNDDWLNTNGHQIAAVLLTEFGVKEALPVLLDGVCHLNPKVVDGFHRVINDYLDQIVGRLADDPVQFRSLAEDPNVSELVRIQLVDAVFWMVMEGTMTRESAIEYLRQWLLQAIETSNELLTASICMALLDLGAKQAEADILHAFAMDCVDQCWLCEEEVEDALQDAEQSFQQALAVRQRKRIEHSLFAVRAWFWQSDESNDDADDADDESDFEEWDDDNRDPFLLPPGLDIERAISYVNGLEELRQMRLAEQARESDNAYHSPAVETIRKLDPKVGRNDPCPCGSGKKHKKCCLKGDA